MRKPSRPPSALPIIPLASGADIEFEPAACTARRGEIKARHQRHADRREIGAEAPCALHPALPCGKTQAGGKNIGDMNVVGKYPDLRMLALKAYADTDLAGEHQPAA